MPPPNKRTRGKTVSLYLDPETAELYDELKRRGQSISPLLGEFFRTISIPAPALATVQYPLYSLGCDLDDDPFRFEKWIDTGKARQVILMGTTLYSALLGPDGKSVRPVWHDLLEEKATLTILLQGISTDQSGEFGFDAATISKLKGEPVESIIAHSETVKQHLTNLAGKYETLDVRLAKGSINYSAFIVRNQKDAAAVQIHPYTGIGANVGVRANFASHEHTRLNQEVLYQLSAVWKSATPLRI